MYTFLSADYVIGAAKRLVIVLRITYVDRHSVVATPTIAASSIAAAVVSVRCRSLLSLEQNI